MNVFRDVVGRGKEMFCNCVGLDLVLALSEVQRCSLKQSLKHRLVSPMYGKWHLLHWIM